LNLLSIAKSLFDPRGRISRQQAVKLFLLVGAIFAVLWFADNFFYFPGAYELYLIGGAVVSCIFIAGVTKRFHDFNWPTWSALALIIFACAIYWFGYASPERSIHNIMIESLATNPDQMALVLESHAVDSTDTAEDELGTLLAMAIGIDQMELSAAQKKKLSDAEFQMSLGSFLTWAVALVLMATLFLMPGTNGPNRFGPDTIGSA
jgi:uncharacterized membrane protein YhaH (DUF805 family)